MKITSKTGLLASPTKKIIKNEKIKTVQLKAIAKPAPFILKPFAGLFNPYHYTCSLLCNHPTDDEAKELLRKAKDNWASDVKTVLLPEEIEAIRAGLQQITQPSTEQQSPTPKNLVVPQVESVPEELFRRYTETDSRPLTPAPTLASAATRASGSRRCITPDPFPTSQIKERTLLILDLRRSHSQEILSWYGSSSIQEPPLIRIQHMPIRTLSGEEATREGTPSSPKNSSAQSKRPKSSKKTENVENESPKDEKKSEAGSEDEEDEEFVAKKGKKKRKKGKDGSKNLSAFQVNLDPETQVATIGMDSNNASSRPSLVPGNPSQEIPPLGEANKGRSLKSFDVDSYLDIEILKQLRRELNEEIVDSELNYKRRKALEEALKTVTKGKIECKELVALQNEMKLPPINADLWISLPRTFTRSSARFELPLDSRMLSTMTPIDYVKENVYITSARKLLYNCIFNKYKIVSEDTEGYERKLSGSNLQVCLDLVMGKPMSLKQAEYFKNLCGWEETNIFDFKTCCGIFALCERLLAKEFCPQLPDRKSDPCHEIEIADFEVLSRKLHGQKFNERLKNILNGIKTL